MSNIDQITGTTIEERRRIRKKHKDEKVKAQRGIRSRANSEKFREGYDEIDWAKKPEQLELLD